MKGRRGLRQIVRYVFFWMAVMAAVVSFREPLGRAQSQAGATAQSSPKAAPQSFEVASIKPSDPAPNGMFMVRISNDPGGRWTASGITASMLIQQAYDIRDYQISGGPSWLTTERYDIAAKAETPDLDRETLKVLLQSLLAERFKLQVHRETKDGPIYALVVGKDGHKLHKSEFQPDTQGNARPPDPSKPAQAGAADGAEPKGTMIRMGRGQINAQMARVSSIAQMLAQQLGRPVIDKTGIQGAYDFNLQWTPDETQRGLGFGGMAGSAADGAPPVDTSGPSIFTAVQEQLGLKLESARGPVEFLVIDHVEKASRN